jgi:hypothetical protein
MSVIGMWRNEYGSVLDIHAHGPEGQVSGVYTSDTGASGTYPMSGWSPVGPKAADNRPFAACVFWKPTDGSEPDPSWNWVSVMAGVLFFDAPSSPPRIQMLHGLVASTPLEAVMIERSGVYAETLTFQHLDRSGKTPTPTAALNAGSVGAVTHLILTNRDTASRFGDIRLDIHPNGRAEATMCLSGRLTSAQGFADPRPANHLRSLALSALNGAAGERSIALGGFIDLRGGLATLQVMEAAAVTFANKYTAVVLGQETFSVASGV